MTPRRVPTSYWITLLTLAVFFTAFATWTFADPLPALNSFTSGTTISSADVNENFADLRNKTNEHDSRIEAVETSLASSYPTYREPITSTFVASSSLNEAIVPGRSLQLMKVEDSTELHIIYSDTFGLSWPGSETPNRPDSSAQWQVLIDDEPCVTPGPITFDLYVRGQGLNGSNSFRVTGRAEGYCSATSRGSIGTGAHTLTVAVTAEVEGLSQAPNEVYNGEMHANAPTTGWLQATEVASAP